jgi:hypothetical protein
MSLISFSSPWVSDDSQKKRQPTMMSKNKTIKKTMNLPTPQPDIKDDYIGASLQDSRGLDTHSMFSQENENILLNTKNDVPIFATSNDNRQDRINELVQKMHTQNVDNDGNNLADFKPLSHPIVNIKKPEIIHGDLPTYLPGTNVEKPPTSLPPQATFSPNRLNQMEFMSNYNTVYQAPSSHGSNGFSMSSASSQETEPRLLEKINYMIHLLEEQTKEKTSHGLEEFVMFSLVGVFIIYVLDSFSRSGRYIR